MYPQYEKFYKAKGKAYPTMTSLAYIDGATSAAVIKELDRPTIDDKARAEIKTKASKRIAGFQVYDQAAENKMLDEMIADRRARLETFIEDRKKVRESLTSLGVTALAVLPTVAWSDICQRAKLFRFSPNAQNKVRIDRMNFHLMYGGKAKEAEAGAKAGWTGFLLSLFPAYSEAHQDGHGHTATLVLPNPPADVVEILIKAQSRKLQVAAVADAIRLLESPSELVAHTAFTERDLWARAQGYADMADWVKRDPIVYTEEGTATAIIAQFGEFPIEKQVVDFVVASGKLIPDKISALSPLAYSSAPMSMTGLADYQRQMAVMQAHAYQGIPYLANGGGGSTITAMGSFTAGHTHTFGSR